ncbi:MAG: hypothetical protein WC001_01760 [Desulfurivibrionaceae bacterium]
MNLNLPFGQKNYLALTGDSQNSMLATIARSRSGAANLRILARTDSAITAEVAIPRLLAAAGSIKGQVSMTLPLAFFELVNLSIPAMPDGSVGKALPYHLARSLGSPLNEFTYDWQITGRFKDRLQITVYLFPVGIFHKIRREFARKQLELAFFEPDVFSAFAFLAQENMLSENEASLCVLLWQDSISLAVYEKGKLPLARTVKAPQPQGEINLQAPEQQTPQAMPEPDDELLIFEQTPQPDRDHLDTTSILADFCVLTTAPAADQSQAGSPAAAKTEDIAASLDESETGETTGNSWAEYLNNIPLEIMRTRDYYASIQKGGTIKNIFVGGADDFWPEFTEACGSLLGLKCKPLTVAGAGEDAPSLLQVMAIGTGARW